MPVSRSRKANALKTRTPIALVTVISALIATHIAAADYVAYSIGEKESSPLPERVDRVDTKYLLNIKWGDYSGPKARLGVLPVDNKSSSTTYTVSSVNGDVDYSASTTGVPVNGIESIVIDSLSQTGRFRLVERTELGSVLGVVWPRYFGPVD